MITQFIKDAVLILIYIFYWSQVGITCNVPFVCSLIMKPYSISSNMYAEYRVSFVQMLECASPLTTKLSTINGNLIHLYDSRIF